VFMNCRSCGSERQSEYGELVICLDCGFMQLRWEQPESLFAGSRSEAIGNLGENMTRQFGTDKQPRRTSASTAVSSSSHPKFSTDQEERRRS